MQKPLSVGFVCAYCGIELDRKDAIAILGKRGNRVAVNAMVHDCCQMLEDSHRVLPAYHVCANCREKAI
jgi:hypothetical protein